MPCASQQASFFDCFCFAMQDLLEMWKADIDSAFRRLPVKAAHRDLTLVAWRVDETHMATASTSVCHSVPWRVCTIGIELVSASAFSYRFVYCSSVLLFQVLF